MFHSIFNNIQNISEYFFSFLGFVMVIAGQILNQVKHALMHGKNL